MYPVPIDYQEFLMGKCWMKKGQRKFCKCNITIINRKLFCGNIIIDTVLFIIKLSKGCVFIFGEGAATASLQNPEVSNDEK